MNIWALQGGNQGCKLGRENLLIPGTELGRYEQLTCPRVREQLCRARHGACPGQGCPTQAPPWRIHTCVGSEPALGTANSKCLIPVPLASVPAPALPPAPSPSPADSTLPWLIC